VCKGCLVEVVEGPDALVHQTVRACTIREPFEGLAIRIPEASRLEARIRIDDDFNCASPVLDPPVRRVRFDPQRPWGSQAPDALTRLREVIAAALGIEVDLAISPNVLRAFAGLVEGDAPLSIVVARESPQRWRIVRAAPQDDKPLVGIAIDIGTTTVAALATDLESGAIFGRAARLNEQIRIADDVASRILQAARPGGLDELRARLLRETFEPLIDELLASASVQRADIVAVALAGNTVMTHLALGLDPAPLGRAPFEPVALDVGMMTAAEAGLPVPPESVVWYLPGVAAYVGGDIVADLFSASVLAREGPVLLVDIGTNGEIVLAQADSLVACATAAGPAFEGAGLSHGCRAMEGAIEHLHLTPEGQLVCETIGHAAPVGLCGSGAVDALARLREAGMVNRMGRLEIARLEREGLLRRLAMHGSAVAAVLLATTDRKSGEREILLTEHDIAEILKAKAAIAAGIASLLEAEGLTHHDLRRVLLAGGFARHLDVASAIAIGLLPDVPLDRFEIVGNGSLAGAWHCLLDQSALQTCREIATMPLVIELNRTPGFEDHFIDGLSLPEPKA
jgi:uncharacterized 2Fe-2S/4Fe-4S cluster protein (DUF4445 family)